MFRTGYSFRTAVGHLPDVLKKVQSLELGCAPVADRCSTFAFARWAKACKKAGTRPVFGVELAVTDKLGDTEPRVDNWMFLAIKDVAFLNELVWSATSNLGKFPQLLLTEALQAEGVIKIGGPSCQLDLLGKKPPKDFYFSLSPASPRPLVKLALEKKIPLIAASDNMYPNEEDREFYRVLLGKSASAQTYPQHILTDAEWLAAVAHLVTPAEAKAALANRTKVLAKCTATLRKATLLEPDKPKTLRQMCIDGAVPLGVDLSDKTYAERLDRELGLIEEKKFENYFYIIADMIAWAKQRMVVGPARGSSCGSLVCYLLGITTIDPLKFDLLFERFIDTTREELPDIDIDFSDERRDQVFRYAEEKYGRDRVARLGTVGSFAPKSVLAQVATSLKVPKWMIDNVTKSIIQRSSGDSRALQQLEDTLTATEAGRKLTSEFPEVMIAGRMEGHPSVPSQHAAGVLLTQEPVRQFVAVDARTRASMCDKKDAEEINLLKIDALGLTQLSIFERTLELIGVGLNKQGNARSGYLETIPLDDPEAFEVLNKQHYAGVFQFMGGALKSLSNQIKFTHLNDLIAITALARPGPMATGGANIWVKRKTEREPIQYAHPLLEPYLKETLGVVVYQEQVMQICREIGELSWGDVNALRRAMSKSLGEEFFNQYGDKWKINAVKRGIPQDSVDTIWKDLCAFGSMGFNKAHAVAYGIVSYYCCWLKAHHPLEFAAATLDAESDPMRQIQSLRELAAEGIGYVPIDAERSGARWEPYVDEETGQRLLLGPLTNVKGIGPAAVRTIENCRADGKEIPPVLMKKLRAAKTPIDTLYPVQDRVKDLYPSGLQQVNIVSEITKIRDVQCDPSSGRWGHEVVVIGVAKKIAPRDENEAVNVAKREQRFLAKGQARSGVLSGPTQSLNMFVSDDTDEVFVKIDRFKFADLGAKVVERGGVGRAIYAIKGRVPPDFRMISVENIRYLGDMPTDNNKALAGGQANKLPSGEQTSDE